MIAKGKGKVANLQISLDNICKVYEKDYRFFDWGCCAVK